MRNLFIYLLVIILFSCSSGPGKNNKEIITVSISPFKYFVEAIAGDDFEVNVMVPSGSDPHIYEPEPGQVLALSRSVAYMSDGYLGFEITWLDRFYEANNKMEKISLADSIDIIRVEGHVDEHTEGADPHYWVSPRSASVIASSVKSVLCRLKPENCSKYESNFEILSDTIASLDKKAMDLFSTFRGRSFMIFHPSLGYLARDYGLRQISVETEGKEPTPSSMKQVIDEARKERITVIFIQKGFDTKNAGAIAADIGAELVDVDPLGEDWYNSVSRIIDSVYESLKKGEKI
jgi:zinc transport system substrate-binding protein